MKSRDSFGFGLLVGAIVPVLGYLLVGGVFELLGSMGIMDEVSGSISGRRERTVLLLAICCSLIPLNIFKRHRMDDSMRGIVLPTVFYVGAWIWLFKGALFGL